MIYSEVIYDMTLDTNSADSMLPALIIKKAADIPVFTIEKEGFFEKVQDMVDHQDIDFKEHPDFSDKFVLKGPDESRIRDFFHRGLIKKIEENPHFHIESNGKDIIIYNFDDDSDNESVSQLIRMGKIIALIT
jgi:hypothetical protein